MNSMSRIRPSLERSMQHGSLNLRADLRRFLNDQRLVLSVSHHRTTTIHWITWLPSTHRFPRCSDRSAGIGAEERRGSRRGRGRPAGLVRIEVWIWQAIVGAAFPRCSFFYPCSGITIPLIRLYISVANTSVMPDKKSSALITRKYFEPASLYSVNW